LARGFWSVRAGSFASRQPVAGSYRKRRASCIWRIAAVSTRRIAAGDAGSVTTGFTAAAGYSVLPQLLTAARQRLPGIDLVLQEMVSTEQGTRLSSD